MEFLFDIFWVDICWTVTADDSCLWISTESCIMILELTFCIWLKHQKADGLSNIPMPSIDAFASFFSAELHANIQLLSTSM